MARLFLALILFAGTPGCEPGFPRAGSEATISEDRFVAAMADLRRAALFREGSRLPVQERDRILDEHGLEPEDLLRFVEVHGPDVPYMYRVWTRVEAEIRGTDPGELDPGEDPLEILDGLPEGEGAFRRGAPPPG